MPSQLLPKSSVINLQVHHTRIDPGPSRLFNQPGIRYRASMHHTVQVLPANWSSPLLQSASIHPQPYVSTGVIRGWVQTKALCLWTMTWLVPQTIGSWPGPSKSKLVAPSLGTSASWMQHGNTTLYGTVQPVATSGNILGSTVIIITARSKGSS
jgi:hypothetical protein